MWVWNNDTWQWWLDHGFDGIGAGVIGGLVTWLAVRATIRHENRQRDRAVDDAEIETIRGNVLDLCRSLRELRRVDLADSDGLFNALFDAQDSCWLVVFATDRYPRLQSEVRGWVTALDDVVARDGGEIDSRVLNELRGELWGRCTIWLGDREGHARLPVIDWPTKIAELRASG